MPTSEKVNIQIEDHSTVDKSFEVLLPHGVILSVDYDDVNHPEVDAVIEVLKVIIDKHWNEDLFNKKHKEKVLALWEDNINGIQSDYFSEGGFEGFLKAYGLLK